MGIVTGTLAWTRARAVQNLGRGKSATEIFDSGIPVFGEADERTLNQIRVCARTADKVALMSEGFKEKIHMKRNTVKTIALALFALSLALGVAQYAQAEDAKNPYPTSMAPLDQYLMDRDAEVALARSAAPPSVAKDATVMILGRDGYEIAVEGTNGFVCVVERPWMDQFENSPEFWNPKRLGPDCYNPPAARTVLPILLIRTKLALAGKSKAEMNEGMKAAIEKGELSALEELK